MVSSFFLVQVSGELVMASKSMGPRGWALFGPGDARASATQTAVASGLLGEPAGLLKLRRLCRHLSGIRTFAVAFP